MVSHVLEYKLPAALPSRQRAVPATGFNVFGESLGESVTIPASEGALAGTYTYSSTYSPTIGLPKTVVDPAAGNLSQETQTIGYSVSSGIDLPNTFSLGLNQLVHNVTYTAYGQVGLQQLGSASYYANVTNTFDPHTGALTDTQVKNPAVSATPLDDTSYTYDAAGNPVSQGVNRQGTASETQCYQYDPLNRLTAAWTATDACAADPATNAGSTVGDGIAGGAYWTSWMHDAIGQRQSETAHGLSGAQDTTTTYTYGGTATGCTTAGGAHTLASTSTTGGSTGTATYCYDKNGNTTQRNTPAQGQQSLTWSDTGQLTAVTTASAGSSYIYGPDGALLLQKNPGTTTLYLPGQQLALNTSTQALTATRFYALPGGGQAVRTGTGSAYNFEITDQHNTSTLTLSNTLTNPTWRQQTPYGAPRGTAPTSWPDNHGFLNKPQDASTGLTAVGARWYDPAVGRFTSLDPAFEATDPQQQNGYTYAGANPVTASDPTGLTRCDADPELCGPGTGGTGGNGGTGGCDPQCVAAQLAAAAKAVEEVSIHL